MATFATGSTGTIGKFFPDSVIPMRINLTSAIEEFEQLPLENNDVVIHAAAVVGPRVVDKDPFAAREVNIEGTRKLGLATLSKGISKFVYISTSHVYRFGPEYLLENDEVAPVNEYANQKYEGEKILEAIFSQALERLCILRVFSILDWGMPEYSLGGAVEKLAAKDSNFILRNAGDVRDFLTPKQVAEVIYEISGAEAASGVINLCSSKPTSVSGAVRYLFALENIEIRENSLSGGNSLVPRIVGNNSKLKSLVPKLELEWKPSSRINRENSS